MKLQRLKSLKNLKKTKGKERITGSSFGNKKKEVNNVNSLDYILSEYFDDRECLSHHGIKGQKWGIRNAEWYPIEAYRRSKGIVKEKAEAVSKAAGPVVDAAKSVAKKTGVAITEAAKTAKEAHEEHKKEKKKKEQLKKMKAGREAKARERKEAADFEVEKRRILNEGSPGEVLRIADKLTNEELNYAKNRNELIRQLTEAEGKRLTREKRSDFNKKWGTIIDVADTLKMVSEPAGTAADALQNFNKLKKAVNGTTGEDKNKSKNDDGKNNDGKNKNKGENISGNRGFLDRIFGNKNTTGTSSKQSIDYSKEKDFNTFSADEKKYWNDLAKNEGEYNLSFLETVQNDPVLHKGGKELQKEYKKFIDAPYHYMTTFQESDYAKNRRSGKNHHYKNSKAVREAMRIAKAYGWGALSEHQKDLLNSLDE